MTTCTGLQVHRAVPGGAMLYFNDPVSGAMSELASLSTGNTWHDYIRVDGNLVAERFCTGGVPCSATPSWRYYVTDHLGSVAVATDGAGAVVERDAYDPWGKRRNPITGADDPACSLTSATTRGFTGHEHIDAQCLINANARIYDETVGRFLTPDDVVADVYDDQGLNRYTYVDNRPLTLTDPSGHFGCMGTACSNAQFAEYAAANGQVGSLYGSAPSETTISSGEGYEFSATIYGEAGRITVGNNVTGASITGWAGRVADATPTGTNSAANPDHARPNLSLNCRTGNFIWGIQVDQTTAYPGITIGIQYSGDTHGLQWIQTYRKHDIGEDGNWHPDVGRTSTPPFYDSKNALRMRPGLFYDNPQVHGSVPADFTAKVRAVTVGEDGSQAILGSFTYGFSFSDGVITRTTLKRIRGGE